MPKYYEVTEEAKSDAWKIFVGLAVFVLILGAASFYNWYHGKARAKPVLEYPRAAKKCVRDARYMRENHMKILDDWREQVVRNGNRGTILIDGKPYEKSLTSGCLKCHDNKAAFCDKCHLWAGVKRAGAELNCWHCHIIPTQPKTVATAPAKPAATPEGR
jgi:hypothetical protein